ncbi:hypothetical protein CR513_16797, partial [Mucuna pruriens]
RRSPQALKGIPCGLLHNEAARDTRGIHQNEGISIFLGWSCKGLAVFVVGSLQHLGDMKRMFLEKFFPASRTTTIRKEICGIRQHSGETLHEYWERFNKLCATCSHHQINEQLLSQYFYEGLTMMDRSMIDATRGGALMNKMQAIHTTDMCPALQETVSDYSASVGAIGGYQYGKRPYQSQ